MEGVFGFISSATVEVLEAITAPEHQAVAYPLAIVVVGVVLAFGFYFQLRNLARRSDLVASGGHNSGGLFEVSINLLAVRRDWVALVAEVTTVPLWWRMGRRLLHIQQGRADPKGSVSRYVLYDISRLSAAEAESRRPMFRRKVIAPTVLGLYWGLVLAVATVPFSMSTAGYSPWLYVPATIGAMVFYAFTGRLGSVFAPLTLAWFTISMVALLAHGADIMVASSVIEVMWPGHAELCMGYGEGMEDPAQLRGCLIAKEGLSLVALTAQSWGPTLYYAGLEFLKWLYE